MRTVYLAGPDVFHPDAELLADEHKAICQKYGFEPLHPIDQPNLTSSHVFKTNIELLNQADGVLADLNPFRGAEVDSGTAFEVGFAYAKGKPVVGYLDSPEFLKCRVDALFGPLLEQDGICRDQRGYLVENLDHPVNLMLANSCILVIGGFEDAVRMLGLIPELDRCSISPKVRA